MTKKIKFLCLFLCILSACKTNEAHHNNEIKTAMLPNADTNKLDSVVSVVGSDSVVASSPQKIPVKTMKRDSLQSKTAKQNIQKKKQDSSKISPNDAPNQKELDAIKKKKMEEKKKLETPKQNTQPNDNG